MKFLKRKHSLRPEFLKFAKRPAFLKAGDEIIPLSRIDRIDISSVEKEHVTIHHNGKTTEVYGIEALEAVMATKPSALEGRRLKWHKHGWAIHNLIGHPLMQMLSFGHFYKAAMRVHDLTTPTPVSRGVPKPPEMK